MVLLDTFVKMTYIQGNENGDYEKTKLYVIPFFYTPSKFLDTVYHKYQPLLKKLKKRSLVWNPPN